MNDARLYNLHHGIPAFCDGPEAEGIHGFHERVNIQSVRDATVVIVRFIAAWCGCVQAEGPA